MDSLKKENVMKIQKLEPSFSGIISVENAQGDAIFAKPIKTIGEANEFLERYGNSLEQWTPFRATLVPMRTDTVEHFFNDLCLPNFLRVSGKINGFIDEFLNLIVDLVTLPVRLLTAPFRIIYNKCTTREKHPLVDLVNRYALSWLPQGTNVLRIKITFEKINILKETKHLEGIIQPATKQSSIYTRDVTLMLLPHIKNNSKLTTTTTTFLKNADGWLEVDQRTNIDDRIVTLIG